MIRTGILGTSGTANLFAGFLKGSDKYALTGCYSPDYNKTRAFAEAFADRHELVAFPSVEALFNYTDALIITDFSPDFLATAEKAIKNFKHILITNPFLAGLDEIQYLRKLSEESGVFMQISGGFKFKNSFPDIENCYFLADLIHTFNSDSHIYNSSKFMEFLLCDISLLLILLKGMPKKVSINSWEIKDKSIELLSARIELDNGCVANILFGDLEDKNNFSLSLYGTDGDKKHDFLNPVNELESSNLGSITNELIHFERSIRNRYLASVHNDVMFQALELAHKIKAKTTQNFAVKFPD